MREQGHRQKSLPSTLGAALLAMCLPVVITCGNLAVDGGFGSETTNGRVSGRVVYTDGSPAQGVHFIVRRDDYLASPQSALVNAWENGGDGTTDTDGRFVFDSLDTGNYIIEINDEAARALLKQGRIAPALLSIDVGTDTLRSHATVRGEINIDASAGADWYVQVYGLERCVAIDSAGTYTLSDLPAGTFRLRMVCGDPAVSPLIVDNVAVASGATTTVPAVGWRSSRQLVLNTSAGGADISGTVYKFPLLVKLREGVNFLFNGARRNGEDIRFLSPDSRMLPYEIERWDSVNGQADIWVLVDTVYGSNSAQYITMQWGSSSARDNSNGAAVFDTGNGYTAVWHLNGDCNDAGYKGHDGTACSALDTAGIAGLGKKFRGSDSIKIPGRLGSPASITLSAWAQLDSAPPDGGSEILSLGDAALIRMDYALDSVGTLGSIHLSDGTIFDNVTSGRFLKKTGWHLITFTVNQSNHTRALYIDGMNVRSRTDMNAINYSGVGQNTFIGKHGNGKTNFNFSGRIDEVRVFRAPVSIDYIRLCYMNQKAQDALVVFK
jgi:hypothetical protein